MLTPYFVFDESQDQQSLAEIQDTKNAKNYISFLFSSLKSTSGPALSGTNNFASSYAPVTSFLVQGFGFPREKSSLKGLLLKPLAKKRVSGDYT